MGEVKGKVEFDLWVYPSTMRTSLKMDGSLKNPATAGKTGTATH